MSTSPERRLAALAASCHSHLACTPAENSLYCQWYQYCVVVSGSIKHNDIVTPIYIYIYIYIHVWLFVRCMFLAILATSAGGLMYSASASVTLLLLLLIIIIYEY